jgi:hypothetical protein
MRRQQPAFTGFLIPKTKKLFKGGAQHHKALLCAVKTKTIKQINQRK